MDVPQVSMYVSTGGGTSSKYLSMHGQWTYDESFFQKYPKLLADLGRWAEKIVGYFQLLAHILSWCVPTPWFSINQQLFQQKTNKQILRHFINMSSLIVFILKMESVSKNTIFGLKMMVKNGLEKNILNSLHAGR